MKKAALLEADHPLLTAHLQNVTHKIALNFTPTTYGIFSHLYGTFSYCIGKCTNRKKYHYGTISLGKSTILHLVLFPTGTFS